MSRKSSSEHVLGYPYNLVEDVLQEECQDILDQDRIDGIEMAVSTLSEREQYVFGLRYQRELTLREAGVLLNVGPERVRQIQAKALRKLRTPSRIRLIKYGRSIVEAENEVNRLRAELAEIRRELMAEKERLLTEGLTEGEIESSELYSRDVIELDLSVRAFNCLRRGGINTIGELIRACQTAAREHGQTPIEYFCKTFRNMGRQTALEVIHKMWNVFGIDLNLMAREAMNHES